MPGTERSVRAGRWLEVADRDLAVIRLCLGAEPMQAEVAAYHCQQAVEKVAKAFLVAAGVRFRKTHSIDELAGQLTPIDQSAGDELTRLAWVTAWGFAHRYPQEEEPEPPPTRDELVAVLAATEALRATLLARLDEV